MSVAKELKKLAYEVQNQSIDEWVKQIVAQAWQEADGGYTKLNVDAPPRLVPALAALLRAEPYGFNVRIRENDFGVPSLRITW